MISMSQGIIRQHATGKIVKKWAAVCVYGLAPKFANGNLKNSEVRKLQDSFFKTRGQIQMIIRLVWPADQHHGGALNVLDGRSLNPARPTKLTGKTEEVMKTINKDKLMK